MIRARVVVFVVFAAAWPAPGRADEPLERDTAAQLFRAASAAHARGDFRAAAQAFEEANRHSARSGTLLNAALSWDAAGDAPRAAGDFMRALEMGGLDGAQVTGAQKRLDALKSTLGWVRVQGPPGSSVSIAHVRGAPLPVDVFVAPGSVEVRETRADGSESAELVVLKAGESKLLTFAPLRPQPIAPREPRPSGGSPQRTWALVVLGAAGLGAATGGVLGLEALQARSAYESGGFTSHRAYDQAYAFRTAANVAWITTGVLGAAALVVWLTAPGGPSTDRAASRIDRGARGAYFDAAW